MIKLFGIVTPTFTIISVTSQCRAFSQPHPPCQPNAFESWCWTSKTATSFCGWRWLSTMTRIRMQFHQFHNHDWNKILPGDHIGWIRMQFHNHDWSILKPFDDTKWQKSPRAWTPLLELGAEGASWTKLLSVSQQIKNHSEFGPHFGQQVWPCLTQTRRSRSALHLTGIVQKCSSAQCALPQAASCMRWLDMQIFFTRHPLQEKKTVTKLDAFEQAWMVADMTQTRPYGLGTSHHSICHAARKRRARRAWKNRRCWESVKRIQLTDSPVRRRETAPKSPLVLRCFAWLLDTWYRMYTICNYLSTALDSNITNLPHMSSLQPAGACGFTVGGLGSLRTKPETSSPLNNNLQKASKCLGTKVSAWLRILTYAPKAWCALCPQNMLMIAKKRALAQKTAQDRRKRNLVSHPLLRFRSVTSLPLCCILCLAVSMCCLYLHDISCFNLFPYPIPMLKWWQWYDIKFQIPRSLFQLVLDAVTMCLKGEFLKAARTCEEMSPSLCLSNFFKISSNSTSTCQKRQERIIATLKLEAFPLRRRWGGTWEEGSERSARVSLLWCVFAKARHMSLRTCSAFKGRIICCTTVLLNLYHRALQTRHHRYR